MTTWNASTLIFACPVNDNTFDISLASHIKGEAETISTLLGLPNVANSNVKTLILTDSYLSSADLNNL